MRDGSIQMLFVTGFNELVHVLITKTEQLLWRDPVAFSNFPSDAGREVSALPRLFQRSSPSCTQDSYEIHIIDTSLPAGDAVVRNGEETILTDKFGKRFRKTQTPVSPAAAGNVSQDWDELAGLAFDLPLIPVLFY